MSLVELLIFIGVAIVFLGLSVFILMLLFKVRKLTRTSVQSQIDNFILLSELDKLVQEKDTKSIEQSDGFLKFVSDSRDWAFDYIERVQSAINEYVVALDGGDPDRIAESLEKLTGLLPDK